MGMGPFEYRAHGRSAPGGGVETLKRREHREKLLRTPLRVLRSDEVSQSDEENDSSPIPHPVRNFDCPNYEICLNLTAALNWQSFTCQDCVTIINPAILKRAERALQSDRALEPLIGNFTPKK